MFSYVFKLQCSKDNHVNSRIEWFLSVLLNGTIKCGYSAKLQKTNYRIKKGTFFLNWLNENQL